MSDNCKHDFKEIYKLNRKEDDADGVLLVCIYCGQSRVICSDGSIEIIKEHGEIKRPKQSKSL